MTQCNHDPLFTTDGRCSKCYPPRYARVVMVQHIDGTVEVDSRFAMTDQRVEDVKPLAEESMKRYEEWREAQEIKETPKDCVTSKAIVRYEIKHAHL